MTSNLRRHRAPMAGLATFVVLGGLFTSLWFLNRHHQRQLLELQAAGLARQVTAQLEDAISTRLALVGQFRDEWLLRPYTSREAFESRALTIMRRAPGYLAINWIDPEGIIRWVAPREPNRRAEGRSLRKHPFARETFLAAEATGKDRVTPPIRLFQGGMGLAGYFPIRDGDRNLGYLNAVFRIEPLVAELVPAATLKRFAVRVSGDGRTLFKGGGPPPSGWDGSPSSAWFQVGPVAWVVEAVPSPAAASGQGPAVKWLLLAAGLLFSAAISVLVTVAVRNHDRLRLSERRYRELFEGSVDTVYISTPGGRLLDINPAGVRLFAGSSKEDLLARDVGTELFVDPAERSRFLEHLEEEGAVQGYPLRLRRLDGEKLRVRASATLVRDSSGTPSLIQGILHDETAEARMQDELVRIQRIEAMGQVAGGVAHDFNNILAAIMSNASLLEIQLDDPKLARSLDRIQRSVETAAQLTEKLLDFSRGAVRSKGPVDLNDLADTTLLILERSMDPDIRVIRDLQPSLPPVLGEPGRLQQVILNLLVNARDAMPDGGTLTVSTRTVTGGHGPPPSSEVQADSPPVVELSVTDTGCGMDDATRERIFEPFFTTKDRSKGTGLGLAVVYGIVRDHGGTIEVESAPGAGTRVRVMLPAAEASLPAATAEEGRVSGEAGVTVLVVDDEPDIRSTVAELLELEGYQTLTAADGTEALETVHRLGNGIDLVLLDLTMPGPSGGEVLARIREIDPSIRVILSSGYAEGDWPSGSGAPEPDAFLAKPYRLRELLSLIARLTGEGKTAS